MTYNEAKDQAKIDYKQENVPQAVVQLGRFGDYSVISAIDARRQSLTIFFVVDGLSSKQSRQPTGKLKG